MNIALINENPIIAESLKNILLNRQDVRQVRIFRRFDAFLRSDNTQIQIAVVSFSYSFPEAINMLRLYTDKFSGRIKFIIISDKIEDDYVKMSEACGVWSLLSAAAAREDLCSAIDHAEDNRKFLSEGIKEKMLDMILMQGHAEVVLTELEGSILEKVCHGLSAEEIADAMNMPLHTIKFHKKNMLEKLNLTSRDELTAYARKKGFYRKDQAS